MRIGRGLCLILFCVSALAQEPAIQPGFLLELPSRPGMLQLDAPQFPIVEASAKPAGAEFGLRGEDRSDGIDLLVFLFRLPDEAPMTGAKCRDAMLGHEKAGDRSLTIQSTAILPVGDGSLAVASYSDGADSGRWYHVRAFAADEDLCADVAFSSQKAISTDTPAVQSTLHSVQFDPAAKQDFQGLFEYATVLYRHELWKEAAPVYVRALALLPGSDTSGKWRRVATDQAVLAYGMSGDVAKARALAEAATRTDPDYPLNYYNLACADAEDGNAAQARVHLQEAFDRRKNMLPGEPLPDPTKDDSILKLRADRAFWQFVEGLEKQR